MTSGVPIKLSKTDITNMLIQCKGNVAATARKLNYDRTSLHDFINDNPELKEVIDKARQVKDLDVVQDSINDLLWFKSQRETKPELAYKATIQVLDRKGHLMNWGKSSDRSEEKLNDNELRDYLAELISSNKRLSGTCESEMATE